MGKGTSEKASKKHKSSKRPRAVVETFPTPRMMDFQMAVEAAVIKQQAKGAGYVDLASATYALDTTGSITLIATVPQGVTVNTRVGKKIKWKGLQIRGFAQANPASTINDVAVIIVYDREPTLALPAITAILDSVSSRSMNNDSNSDRFQIVRRIDKVLIGNATTPATGFEAIDFDEYVDLKKRDAQFGALTTGAINDISKGALYLVTVGNVVAGTAAAALTIGIRTRFIDVIG